MSDEISINVNGKSHPILCGRCKKGITFIGESNADSGEAGCVNCGNIDVVQEVGRMAMEYVKDEGQMILNRAARDVARQSKIMSFTGQTKNDKAHRFVIEM